MAGRLPTYESTGPNGAGSGTRAPARRLRRLHRGDSRYDAGGANKSEFTIPSAFTPSAGAWPPSRASHPRPGPRLCRRRASRGLARESRKPPNALARPVRPRRQIRRPWTGGGCGSLRRSRSPEAWPDRRTGLRPRCRARRRWPRCSGFRPCSGACRLQAAYGPEGSGV